jgi:3D-(3,5/4)-trihydroxycyclohexane-1,2-dione acylhydrolase (decyclizing)
MLDNHGFSSIGGLSQAIGSGGFGTNYCERNPETGQLDGERLGVDFEAMARGLGALVTRVRTHDELVAAVEAMQGHDRTSVVVVEVDKEMRVPGYESWWDVPVAEVSETESVRAARAAYEVNVRRERRHEILAPEGE